MIDDLKKLKSWLLAIENRNQELEAENRSLKERNAILQKNIDNCFYQLNRYMLINQELESELEIKKGSNSNEITIK